MGCQYDTYKIAVRVKRQEDFESKIDMLIWSTPTPYDGHTIHCLLARDTNTDAVRRVLELDRRRHQFEQHVACSVESIMTESEVFCNVLVNQRTNNSTPHDCLYTVYMHLIS